MKEVNDKSSFKLNFLTYEWHCHWEEQKILAQDMSDKGLLVEILKELKQNNQI